MDTVRSLVFLALAALAVPAAAQTVHRCKVGDRLAYQDRPCADAASDAGTLVIASCHAGVYAVSASSYPLAQSPGSPSRPTPYWASIRS